MAITDLNVAVNERFKTKDGEQKEKTQFLKLQFFGKLAEWASDYKKGDPILATDLKYEVDTWENKEGETQRTHVFRSGYGSTLQRLHRKPVDAEAQAREDDSNESGGEADALPF